LSRTVASVSFPLRSGSMGPVDGASPGRSVTSTRVYNPRSFQVCKTPMRCRPPACDACLPWLCREIAMSSTVTRTRCPPQLHHPILRSPMGGLDHRLCIGAAVQWGQSGMVDPPPSSAGLHLQIFVPQHDRRKVRLTEDPLVVVQQDRGAHRDQWYRAAQSLHGERELIFKDRHCRHWRCGRRARRRSVGSTMRQVDSGGGPRKRRRVCSPVRRLFY
jgi:hypothetical protein